MLKVVHLLIFSSFSSEQFKYQQYSHGELTLNNTKHKRLILLKTDEKNRKLL